MAGALPSMTFSADVPAVHGGFGLQHADQDLRPLLHKQNPWSIFKYV